MKFGILKPFLKNRRKRLKMLDARREKKINRKAKVYYDKSCSECGLPKEFDGSKSRNRFGHIPGRNTKCVNCGSLLLEDKELCR